MGWHFGHNCKNYLPTINKCRIMIDLYKVRTDLIELKWLNTKEMLIYLNLSNEELIRQITAGVIKVKPQKSGKLSFGVLGAWQYDHCPLIDTGGQCLYFESHQGRAISHLMELSGFDNKHPNFDSTPTEKEIMTFEDVVLSTFVF